MWRHKEKDKEAGGEGLGVLATQKQYWHDAALTQVPEGGPGCCVENSSMTAKRKLGAPGKFECPNPDAQQQQPRFGLI